ncbi:hypothetical protein NKJ71_32620 [Mesorhizobium sp. M0050]|uniref:hypothetical protein n=1 Tax=Mesorhizobium sp. M0050 TaxID=2956861 RepID=UPI00333D90EE
MALLSDGTMAIGSAANAAPASIVKIPAIAIERLRIIVPTLTGAKMYQSSTNLLSHSCNT